MICSRCQTECADNEEFCRVCGNKLTAVKAKMSAPIQNYESEATTLLEDAPAMSADGDETTLLDAPSSYIPPIQPPVTPEPASPPPKPAPSADYRHDTQHKDNSSKIRITAAALIIIVAIIIIAMLLK